MQPNTDRLFYSFHKAVGSLFMWSWQTLLLLGAIWLVMKLRRSQPPAVRYKIWLFGLIAVSTLPLFMAAIHYFQLPRPSSKSFSYLAELPTTVTRQAPRESPVTAIVETPDSITVIKESGAATPSGSQTAWALVFAAWVIGAFITLLRLCVSYWKLHDVRVSARPVSLRQLGITGLDGISAHASSVSIGLSPIVHSPVLTGVIRPMILLPADIVDWTTVEERVSVLRHEIAHLKRLDHYVNLFQSLVSTIFFF